MSCHWCKHFDGPEDYTAELNAIGRCRRYPDHVDVHGHHCCGEFALEKSNFWASGKTSIHTLWIALRECRQEHGKEWSRRIALGKENKALRLQIREFKLQTKTSKESK